MIEHNNDQPSSLAYSLALHNADGIGPRKYAAILEVFPKLNEFFALTGSELKELGLKQKAIDDIKQPDWSRIESELQWAEQNNQHIISLGDSLYPSQLLAIPDPPPILYGRGDLSLLSKPQLAIVGSRNPTHQGREIAFGFAAELAQQGLVITSGLALGIDGASHEGTLKVQGKTIGVMGTGLDRVYPAKHKDLAHRISEQGLLLSEFSPKTPPKAEHFPRRNRIISGLSQGILVVEAAVRSGSLITAKLAMEQGRDVFAIPGSIHNPLSKGCHLLIRQGAKLIDCVTDIIEELSQFFPPAQTLSKTLNLAQSIDLKDNQKQLLDCIEYEMTTVDMIIKRINLKSEDVLTQLLDLEMLGLIKSQSGGYIKLKTSIVE